MVIPGTLQACLLWAEGAKLALERYLAWAPKIIGQSREATTSSALLAPGCWSVFGSVGDPPCREGSPLGTAFLARSGLAWTLPTLSSAWVFPSWWCFVGWYCGVYRSDFLLLPALPPALCAVNY